MFKKLIRGTALCISVYAITILLFFIGYRIAYKNSVTRISNAFSSKNQFASVEAEEPLDGKKIINPEYFIARYDGKSISVYSVSNGKEEFLYTLNVRIEDISKQELYELKKGVTLSTRQALASFEEDFTS